MTKTLNRKQIRKNAWDNTFKRGFKAWLSLAVVCIIFALLGVSESSQISFIDAADNAKGTENMLLPQNVKILEEYIAGASFVKNMHFISEKQAVLFIDIISKSNVWLVSLLGANLAYFRRNSGEVVAVIGISALITFLIRFFLQSAAVVGKDRYALECRYSDKVSVGRILSPFHKGNIPNLMIAMFQYQLITSLWWLTVVGGIYKSYQYRFVPYILAENPQLKWKQAKKLSSEMTAGFKWQMFLNDLSCVHIQLLKIIPLCGILVTVPFETQYLAEQYIVLRSNVNSDLFIEPVFDGRTYLEGNTKTPEYILRSVAIDLPEELKEKRYYTLVEFLYMFFLFSFVGWAWEVVLHIVRDHELVNRGTMYGPWLPIYGAGGAAIIFLLDRFKANKGRFFAMAVIVCGILEFLSSWILDFFFDSHYWNYKDMLINVNGRICLVGLVMFGLGGMAGVYVLAPKLSEFLRSKDKKKVNLICAILCLAFVADALCCAVFGFNAGSGVGGSY